MVLLNARRRIAADKTTHSQSTLGHGVDLSVGRVEWGLHQDAPLQTARIAHGRYGDIQTLTVLREGLDVGRHHDHSHVLGDERLSRHLDAEALEQVGEAAKRVNGVLVAVSVEAHHDPVTHELVVARPGDHN